jgi:hypothetical protein
MPDYHVIVEDTKARRCRRAYTVLANQHCAPARLALELSPIELPSGPAGMARLFDDFDRAVHNFDHQPPMVRPRPRPIDVGG